MDLKNIILKYNLYYLWFGGSIFVIFITSSFRILGELITYGKVGSHNFKYFILLFLIRVIFIIGPIVIWYFFFKRNLITLLIIVTIMTPINGFLNILLNFLTYKSFVLLTLTFSDLGLLYAGIVYIAIFYNGLKLQEPCTLLTGLIIIIPLLAQAAYYVADGVSRINEATNGEPKSAIAAVIGLTIAFFVYIAAGIAFILFPTFILCIKD